jgi:hypothetical protein
MSASSELNAENISGRGSGLGLKQKNSDERDQSSLQSLACVLHVPLSGHVSCVLGQPTRVAAAVSSSDLSKNVAILAAMLSDKRPMLANGRRCPRLSSCVATLFWMSSMHSQATEVQCNKAVRTECVCLCRLAMARLCSAKYCHVIAIRKDSSIANAQR